MGCDGGTIPRRDELVRMKKKPEQKDKEAELAFKWKHCTIRQLPLQSPVVGCYFGRLYSKESVLEGLLDRNTLPESAAHIKALKDVKDLNLTPNPSGGGNPYICPVIGLEMNGKYKFCFLWSCGCVMSERALKQVKTALCHKCQEPFEEKDVVILNAEGDDLELMKERASLRKANKKKSKKNKLDNDASTEKTEEVPKKKLKKEDTIVSKLNSQPEINDPAYKKIKNDYSIAKDPKASEVFKSIFTSHKTATEQDRAHWVTYNPFYN